MIRKALIAALLPLALLAVPAQAAPNMTLLTSVLSQERAWAGLQSKTVTAADGITYAYSEGGPSNGPRVLLIHGFSGSRDNWNRVIHRLTKTYHVYALDLPGHGDTVAPANYDFQLTNQMTSVRAFVQALGIEKGLHVAGHSMGGALAALYTAMYFQEVQSLMLVDTAGVYKNNKALSSDANRLPEMLVRKPGDLKRLLNGLAMYDAPLIPAELLEAQEQVQINHLPNYEKLMKTLIEQAKLYTPDTFKLAVHSIEAPTLIVWGDKDAIIDVAVVDELKENLKNLQDTVIIRDVGHVPILEADYPVSEAYLKFLAKAQATPNKFAPAAVPVAPAK